MERAAVDAIQKLQGRLMAFTRDGEPHVILFLLVGIISVDLVRGKAPAPLRRVPKGQAETRGLPFVR